MKLTVLGNNGPYPKPGGACSGYLFETDDKKILIDCGNGVLSRLLKICSISDIDVIILTHLHSDHISDIMVMKYAIGVNKMKGKCNVTIPLYTPTDDYEMVKRLNYNNSFNIIPIEEDTIINLDDIEITFRRMKHPIKTFAVKIRKGKKTFVYSSDTSYNESLIDFSKNADLLLCESGLLEEDREDNAPHLSAKQAGEIGKKAGVKRLILTHFWPEYNLERVKIEASQSFDSILEISQEMKTYYI
ncbi:MBL fold metallo-hydrolase [Caloranaerobacter azorensis]|uniref:MBL fold metallo-hydrolase n=1 Tax=Caloranaerobacter azorensis TaxID=116090 RepID=A0A6P1YE02_9FIRM|nr:MBL fold metallo-hydrolase [Caloranaerobacter azorensis]QIB26345.1 MBL fold metallo-hydrolase [Caloranaerobacter azorensis]